MEFEKTLKEHRVSKSVEFTRSPESSTAEEGFAFSFFAPTTRCFISVVCCFCFRASSWKNTESLGRLASKEKRQTETAKRKKRERERERKKERYINVF